LEACEDNSGSREGREVICSQINPEDWKKEAERANELLSKKGPEGRKTWQHHIGKMSSMRKVITEETKNSHAGLVEVEKKISEDLQSVHSKETAINERYQDQISNFEREKLRTNDCKAEYNQRAAVVETLAGTLSDLSEQLDEAKDGMQEHSGRVEDSSPVIKLKQGVVKMKKETNELSLRLGVAKQLLATKQKNTRRDGLSIGSGPRNREDDD